MTKRTGNEGARYERRTAIHFAALGKKVVFATLAVVVAIAVVVVIAAVVIVVIVAVVTVAAVVLAAVVAAVVVVVVAVVIVVAVVVVAATGVEVVVGKAVVAIEVEFVAVERDAVPKGVQSESVVYRETAEKMKTQKDDDGKRKLW